MVGEYTTTSTTLPFQSFPTTRVHSSPARCLHLPLTPFRFAIDFPGVDTEVVEVKKQKLDKKKNVITQTNLQTAIGFRKMKNAVILLGQLGETSLTMRYGFYRWKTTTEKIRNQKGESARISVFYGKVS